MDSTQVVDVVGSLCENNDKFAIDRPLPPMDTGDLLLIHDTGAHGHSMGFNYNGKLRPQELLLGTDGSVERIRRAETPADYFATLDFAPQTPGRLRRQSRMKQGFRQTTPCCGPDRPVSMGRTFFSGPWLFHGGKSRLAPTRNREAPFFL